MRYSLLVILLLIKLIVSQAEAREFRLLDVERVSTVITKFGCNREPMTPQYTCADYLGRVATEFDLRLMEVGYWNNYIHTEGMESQVKTVGWHFELGVHAHKYVDVFYEHHSRHVMEGLQPEYRTADRGYRRAKFPVEDSYGVRLNFYINPNPHSNLFGDK